MSVDIKRLTAHLSPQQQTTVRKAYRERAENSTAAFISCFFLGVFGAHRFYLKHWRQGFLHLLLAAVIAAVIVGGLLLGLSVVSASIIAGILLLLALVWVIVDLVRIDDEVANRNIKLAETLIAQTLLSDRTVELQANAKLESLLHETAAQANAAANYGRMQHADMRTETPSPNDTAAAAPIPAIGTTNAQYVADTVTQVSDDPNATQHGSKQAAPHAEASVETDTVSDAPAAEAALAGAALAPLVSEAVTRSHEVSGFSVTDGVETMTTTSIPEQPRAGSLPTSEEANADTWPDSAHVRFDEPVAGARWIAPDVTDRADTHGDVKPVADIEQAGALPLHVALDDAAAASGAGLGAAGLAAAAAPFSTQDSASAHTSDEATMPPVVAVEPAAAASAPADEGMLYLMPEETPAAAPSFETPAASYIPPVATVSGTNEHEAPEAFAAEPEPFVAAAVPAAYEAALEPQPAVHEQPSAAIEPEPEPASEPAPEPAHHAHSDAGTAAELAGLAGLAGLAASAADEAVSLARAHRESLAAAETPSPVSETPVAPVEQEAASADQPETLAEVATSPAPAGDDAMPAPMAAAAEPKAEAAPAAEPVEDMHTMPELEAVHVAAAPSGQADAASGEAVAHRQLKRVRVVRQLKVDGKVVEENVAEEYIDPDADPAPVKARLREQLRQQAEAHTTAHG